MKKPSFFLIATCFLFISCNSASNYVEDSQEDLSEEIYGQEESFVPLEEVVGVQYLSPFEKTPVLIALLEGKSYVFGLFSEVEGGCSSAPSGEHCAYAVWNIDTGLLEYSKEPAAWTEWIHWGGAFEWHNETTIISLTTFGDSARYELVFNGYNFKSHDTIELWKLYSVGDSGDHRLFALNFAGQTYFLDDTVAGSFTIYEALDPNFMQWGDGIGTSSILYDKLKKLDQVASSGELLIQDDYRGLYFSLGEISCSFDFSTQKIVSD